MTRLTRRLEILVALSSLGAMAASVSWLSPDARLAGAAVLLAIAWSVVPFVIDAFLAPRPDRSIADGDQPATVTTIVCVGDEPPDIARATIVLAAQVGPTVVATASRPELSDELGSAELPVVVSSTLDAALREALGTVQTDAVLLTSASAFPTTEVTAAAGSLDERIGWVIGRVEPFAPDAFDPGAHDEHDARLRSRARSGGMVVWEPDATIVRTDLIRGMRTEPGSPRGAWLRSLAERGIEGVESHTTVARRTAPTDGPLFWSSEVMRRRGLVADLVGAVRAGRIGARLLAMARLARELTAYQIVVWLAVPILVARSGAFPFEVGAAAFIVIHSALAAGRWTTSRVRLGTPLHPVREMLATVYEAPASLLAFTSLTGRIRRLRIRFPDQPLLFATIALTLAIALPLLDRPATADTSIDATVGVAVLALIALWISAVHAVGPRAWSRSTYRLAIDAAATVSGVACRLRDASPSGAAVVGRLSEVVVGSDVELSVSFPRSAPVEVPATVTGTRPAADGEVVLGLALRLNPGDRERWIHAMARAARLTDAHAELPRSAVHLWRRPPEVEVEHRRGPRRWIRRVELLVVALVSVALVSAVVLAAVGHRPLVVRSGSMAPTLEVGDVAIVDWRRASDVEVGDIVTFESADVDAQSVTHRVQDIVVADGTITFETQGDANESTESWAVPEEELVGLVVGQVPVIGGVIAGLGRLRAVILGVGIGLVLLAVVVARGRRRSNEVVLESSRPGELTACPPSPAPPPPRAR